MSIHGKRVTYVSVVNKVAVTVAIPLKNEIPGQNKVIPGSLDKLLKLVKSLNSAFVTISHNIDSCWLSPICSGADQCASLHSTTCCSSPCCFPDSVYSGSHHSDGCAYSETAQESRRRTP